MKTLRRISKDRAFAHVRILAAVLLVLAAAALVFLAVSPPAAAQSTPRTQRLTPTFYRPVAFDVSPALRSLPPAARPLVFDPNKIIEVRPERRGSEGPEAHRVKAYSADGVLQLFGPATTILSRSAVQNGAIVSSTSLPKSTSCQRESDSRAWARANAPMRSSTAAPATCPCARKSRR